MQLMPCISVGCRERLEEPVPVSTVSRGPRLIAARVNARGVEGSAATPTAAGYSLRKTSIGSTRAARQAGRKQAVRLTSESTTATPRKTSCVTRPAEAPQGQAHAEFVGALAHQAGHHAADAHAGPRDLRTDHPGDSLVSVP